MSKEKDFFISHMQSLRNIEVIFGYIQKNAPMLIPQSLLRAEFVLMVSAFDNYLHQVVRKNIVKHFFESAPLTTKLQLPIRITKEISTLPNDEDKKTTLSLELKKTLSKDSYQSPQSVEFALSLIGLEKIWTKVSNQMSDTPERIRQTLSVIVNRRNKIAHEADIDQSTGDHTPIDLESIQDCYSFLCKLVASIDNLIDNI